MAKSGPMDAHRHAGVQQLAAVPAAVAIASWVPAWSDGANPLASARAARSHTAARHPIAVRVVHAEQTGGQNPIPTARSRPQAEADHAITWRDVTSSCRYSHAPIYWPPAPGNTPSPGRPLVQRPDRGCAQGSRAWRRCQALRHRSCRCRRRQRSPLCRLLFAQRTKRPACLGWRPYQSRNSSTVHFRFGTTVSCMRPLPCDPRRQELYSPGSTLSAST